MRLQLQWFQSAGPVKLSRPAKVIPASATLLVAPEVSAATIPKEDGGVRFKVSVTLEYWAASLAWPWKRRVEPLKRRVEPLKR